jgi:GGDEF domain-containing protein
MKKITWLNTKNRGQNSRHKIDKIMLRDNQTGLYRQEYFNELLAIEKKRCGRSGGPVFLMLADLSAFSDVLERQKVAKSVTDVLIDVTRDTDVKGWHVDGMVIGVIFTEISGKEAKSATVPNRVANKCLTRLQSSLGSESYSYIQISWQELHGGHIQDVHTASKGSN